MVKKYAVEEACEIIFNLPSDSEISALSDDDNDIDFSLVPITRINNLVQEECMEKERGGHIKLSRK